MKQKGKLESKDGVTFRTREKSLSSTHRLVGNTGFQTHMMKLLISFSKEKATLRRIMNLLRPILGGGQKKWTIK